MSRTNTELNNTPSYPSFLKVHALAVSVIIPTYNRKEELQGLFDYLDKQTLPSRLFEIIVVDDGSTDDTTAYLKNLIEKGKDNLLFCYQHNQGPGAARNRGMAMSRANIFAFIDTDCRPLPSWLEELIRPFSDKQVGAVGGAEEYMPEDSVLGQAIHFCMTSPFTTGGLRGKSGRKLANYYPRTFNMAISREALYKTGGFKPLYHGEDIELSFRIKEAGFSLLYNEGAKVHHRRRVTVRQFFNQLLKMGEVRVTLARLHPEMLELLHVVPAGGILILALAIILSSFFSIFLGMLELMIFSGLIFLGVVGFVSFNRTKNLKLFFLVPVLFILQHCAYGMGFYRGLWKWLRPGDAKVKREK